jgi:hypothetical protein
VTLWQTKRAWIETGGVLRRTTTFVKGFRTPVRYGRGRMHGGRRPKSLEGGNRGGSLRRRWCQSIGFNANVRSDFSVPDRDDGRASYREAGFGRPGCDRNGGVVLSESVVWRSKGALTVAVAGARPLPMRYWHGTGAVIGDGDRSVLVMSCRPRLTGGATAAAGSRVRSSRR